MHMRYTILSVLVLCEALGTGMSITNYTPKAIWPVAGPRGTFIKSGRSSLLTHIKPCLICDWVA